MFRYDPDNIQALLDDYNAQIGAQYIGKDSNAWAFVNDDGIVLDYYVTDVSGEWVDFTAPPDPDHDGFDRVIERARMTGVTNILILHNHPPEKDGPCDSLDDFVRTAAARFDNVGLAMRGCIVSVKGEMRVLITAEKTSLGANLLDAGPELLDAVRQMASEGDPIARALVNDMTSIVEAMQRGDRPDDEAVLNAINILERGMRGEMPTPRPNPLSLPPLLVNKGDYLN